MNDIDYIEYDSELYKIGMVIVHYKTGEVIEVSEDEILIEW